MSFLERSQAVEYPELTTRRRCSVHNDESFVVAATTRSACVLDSKWPYFLLSDGVHRGHCVSLEMELELMRVEWVIGELE